MMVPVSELVANVLSPQNLLRAPFRIRYHSSNDLEINHPAVICYVCASIGGVANGKKALFEIDTSCPYDRVPYPEADLGAVSRTACRARKSARSYSIAFAARLARSPVPYLASTLRPAAATMSETVSSIEYRGSQEQCSLIFAGLPAMSDWEAIVLLGVERTTASRHPAA